MGTKQKCFQCVTNLNVTHTHTQRQSHTNTHTRIHTLLCCAKKQRKSIKSVDCRHFIGHILPKSFVSENENIEHHTFGISNKYNYTVHLRSLAIIG